MCGSFLREARENRWTLVEPRWPEVGKNGAGLSRTAPGGSVHSDGGDGSAAACFGLSVTASMRYGKMPTPRALMR